MVLVDSSVWIAHFRYGEPELADLLSNGRVLMYPFIRGELACGKLKTRVTILSDLSALPRAQRASDADAMHLIDVRRLWRRGLGWVNAHLLAAALVSNCSFWTLDKRLARQRLNCVELSVPGTITAVLRSQLPGKATIRDRSKSH